MALVVSLLPHEYLTLLLLHVVCYENKQHQSKTMMGNMICQLLLSSIGVSRQATHDGKHDLPINTEQYRC